MSRITMPNTPLQAGQMLQYKCTLDSCTLHLFYAAQQLGINVNYTARVGRAGDSTTNEWITTAIP